MVAWESINWASNSNFIILFILHTQHLNMSSISPDFKLMSDSKEYLNTYYVKMQVLVWLDTPGMCTVSMSRLWTFLILCQYQLLSKSHIFTAICSVLISTTTQTLFVKKSLNKTFFLFETFTNVNIH